MKSFSEVIREDQVLDLGPLPAPRLGPEVTLQQALPFLARGRRGAVVVVEGMRPIGIFTERDVVARMPRDSYASRARRTEIPLREVMSSPAVTVRRQTPLAEAIELMVDGGLRHLVVVDGAGDLRGLLTSNDLVQFLTDQFPEHTVNLPPRLRQMYRTPEGA